MAKEVSYRDFTNHLIETLFIDHKTEIISILERTQGAREFFNQLLAGKQYAYDYSEFIETNRSFRNKFRQFRQIDRDCSTSAFNEAVIQLKANFLQIFDEQQDEYNKMKLAASFLKSVLQNDKKLDSQIKMQEVPFQNFKKSQEKIHTQKIQNTNKQRNKIIQQEPKKIDQIKKQYQERAHNKNLQQKNINFQNNKKYQKHDNKNNDSRYKQRQKQSNQSQPKKKQQENVPQKFQQDKLQQKDVIKIDSNLLKVEIRYLQTAVDYENYESNGFKLKNYLNNYIISYLSKNRITVRKQMKQIIIMDDTVYIKSQDAGNYKFNPFFDVIQIKIKKEDNTNFDKHFQILNAKNIKIIPKAIKLLDWSKDLLKMTLTTPIQELIKYVCQKRQAKKNVAQALQLGLISLGGASTIQDLFSWDKSDYTTVKVPAVYIYELQDLIEQIKDSSKVVKQRKIGDQRRQCIKVANSHKILRYLVYKTQQTQVAKIAWLNMKNLEKAIKIVKQQIYNESLLDQLNEYFNQFALDPQGKTIKFSRGLVLYGPPGTGKTVLTQSLPNIIGFHLIQQGLSSADFMKTNVGESGRMVRDLVNRAAISPYLLCSVGIDQVEGFVPDRKDKDEKNKGQGISMLLSVLGGNKNVPNLVFMTSTNYLKKIDEAIRRRLSGQYQVGRPDPWARSKIAIKQVEYLSLQQNESLLSHLVKITSNFTGAAMEAVAHYLLKLLKIKKMKKQKVQLSIDQITNVTILIARQFSITLGVYTLPQIYTQNKEGKTFLFSQNFLSKIAHHFLAVKYSKKNQYQIIYSNQILREVNGQIISYYEKQIDKITLNVRNNSPIISFLNFINLTFNQRNKFFLKIFQASQANSYHRYVNNILEYLVEWQNYKNNKQKKTVLFVEDYPGNEGSIKFDTKLFERNHPNLFVIYYIPQKVDLTSFFSVFFGNWEQKQNQDFTFTRMRSNEQKRKPLKYTGRILIQLNEQNRMAFELKSTFKQQSKVAFRLFLRSQESNSLKDVIPQLIDFYTQQQVSYILLIDYELLLQNDAFEEKKILQVMQEKMMEAKNYEKVAVIINADSMILLNESASDSNFGRSMSYSIQNHNLFQILLSYMREFAIVKGNISKWMTIVARHPQLIKIIKNSLDWPQYPDQRDRRLQEEEKDVQKLCVRCHTFYTDRKNMQERKCMQHPGKIINTESQTFQQFSTPEELKAKLLKQKSRLKENKNINENKYIYACCMKNITEQGQKALNLGQSRIFYIKKGWKIRKDGIKYFNYFNEKLYKNG